MKRSVQTDLAALNRIKLNIEALIVDYPRLVTCLHDAQRGPCGGSLGPTSRGQISDPTFTALMFTPEKVTVLPDGTEITEGGQLLPDPAVVDIEALGRHITGLLTHSSRARDIQQRTLRDAAPANWCGNVHGCPQGRKADGWNGRCKACAQHHWRNGEDRQGIGRVA